MGLAHSRPQPKRLGVSEPIREYRTKSPVKKTSPRSKTTPKRTKKKGKK